MENLTCQKQFISAVEPNSPAEKYGILPGETLLSIGGEPVVDVVDYEYLTANRSCVLRVLSANGKRERTVRIRKEEWEPLGLSFATSLMSPMRTCSNHCVFCFIDQMPKGVRSSLCVKDDDWRLSFIMGNYVTLTNAGDAEFERILARRISPLYVSVHATDPAVRCSMMNNRNAGKLMERLTRLKDAGLRFHAQVVLCPGVNDGAVLDKTVAELAGLMPAAQSMAIVPVGLTRFREGLPKLQSFTKQQAQALIRHVASMQARFLEEYGTAFVFLSDEWYLKAEMELPPAAAYEAYPQIENGVGLLRLFEEDMLESLSGKAVLNASKTVEIAGGEGAYPFFRTLYQEALQPYGISVCLHPVHNTYFGPEINVAGLITGQDLIGQLRGKLLSKALLIPRTMLREQEDVFLDGVTLREAEKELDVEILPFRDGGELIEIIFGSNTHE